MSNTAQVTLVNSWLTIRGFNFYYLNEAQNLLSETVIHHYPRKSWNVTSADIEGNL